MPNSLHLTFSDEANARFEKLVKTANCSNAELIRNALASYELLLEYVKEYNAKIIIRTIEKDGKTKIEDFEFILPTTPETHGVIDSPTKSTPIKTTNKIIRFLEAILNSSILPTSVLFISGMMEIALGHKINADIAFTGLLVVLALSPWNKK